LQGVSGFLYDDAYISFRYAQHVAAGHGLVWNIGAEPTQGYTNFLFVLLTASAIKLGVTAENAAHILNLIGMLGISLSFYRLGRAFLPSWGASLFPAILTACYPLLITNAMTGMETVFWVGLVFITAALAFQLWDSAETRERWLVLFTVTAFLSALTRPEGALFAALWYGILWLAMPGYRLKILIAGVIFGIAGVAYLAWLQSYFGAILPNSFYVKVSDGNLFPGRGYVEEFLKNQLLPTVWFGVFGIIGVLVFRKTPQRLALWGAILAVPLTLLPFYLLSYPWMGLYDRFLLPVLCVWVGVGAIGIMVTLTRLERINRLLQIHPLIVMIALLPGLLHTANVLSTPPPAGSLFDANRKVGLALKSVTGHEQVMVAYNDVGILPYVSGVKNLDTVGLNNNRIARDGKREGWLWVVGYVLGTRPDVIGFYTFPDGTVYNFGHGVIGGYYSVLAEAKDFQGNYTFGGAFNADWVHLKFYVWNESVHRDGLLKALRAAADVP
jgi:hypothetical protein